MKAKQYDSKGKQLNDVSLNPEIFGQEVNDSLLAQYNRVHTKRRALGTKKTKGRGEVAGGGRKPWPQKGTGRARHGSIRSPLWIGGGHTHAITPQMQARVKMNRKMRTKALTSALSLLAGKDGIYSLTEYTPKSPKTKEFNTILKAMELQGEQVLVVTPEKNDVIEKSVRNINNVTAVEARLLNPVLVLQFNNILFVNNALEALEQGGQDE